MALEIKGTNQSSPSRASLHFCRCSTFILQVAAAASALAAAKEHSRQILEGREKSFEELEEEDVMRTVRGIRLSPWDNGSMSAL
jgi:hypothetical protein